MISCQYNTELVRKFYLEGMPPTRSMIQNHNDKFLFMPEPNYP